MRDPNRLEVLERATELTILTYAAVATLPRSERSNLVDQLTRAAVSVGSNISEGCGRSTEPAFLHYLEQAAASAAEVEYQASLTMRLALGDRIAFGRVVSMAQRVKIMLTRLRDSRRRDG